MTVYRDIKIGKYSLMFWEERRDPDGRSEYYDNGRIDFQDKCSVDLKDDIDRRRPSPDGPTYTLGDFFQDYNTAKTNRLKRGHASPRPIEELYSGFEKFREKQRALRQRFEFFLTDLSAKRLLTQKHADYLKQRISEYTLWENAGRIYAIFDNDGSQNKGGLSHDDHLLIIKTSCEIVYNGSLSPDELPDAIQGELCKLHGKFGRLFACSSFPNK